MELEYPKVRTVQYFALGISAMKHSGFLAFLVRFSPILSSPHPSKYCLQYLRTIPGSQEDCCILGVLCLEPLLYRYRIPRKIKHLGEKFHRIGVLCRVRQLGYHKLWYPILKKRDWSVSTTLLQSKGYCNVLRFQFGSLKKEKAELIANCDR